MIGIEWRARVGDGHGVSWLAGRLARMCAGKNTDQCLRWQTRQCNGTSGRDPHQRKAGGVVAACLSHQGHDPEGGAAIDQGDAESIQLGRQYFKEDEQGLRDARREIGRSAHQHEDRSGAGQP